MDLFKTGPEQLAAYIQFLAMFSRSPRRALEPSLARDADTPQKVSPQLILYMGLSVGLALLLNLIGTAVGMAPDSSWIVAAVNRIDEKVLPLAAVALTVITAVVWHALAKIVGWLLALVSYASPFRAAVAGSINALLAFTSWFLPLFTIVLVAIRIAIAQLPGVPPLVFLILVVPTSLLFLIYFVLSFAAAHRVSAGYVFILFGFTVTGLLWVADVVGRR